MLLLSVVVGCYYYCSYASSFRVTAINMLNTHATVMDPVKVLQCLPDDINLHELADYLAQVPVPVRYGAL